MDSKPAVSPSATDVASIQLSGSPPPPLIRAPPSYDSDTETVVKTDNDLKINGSTSTSSSSSGSSSVRSDGSEPAFVSGDEDFETASERPFVGDADEETLEKPVEEGEDVDAPFLESYMGPSEFSMMPKTAMPIAKVSAYDDDDGDEDVVESPKGSTFEAEMVEDVVGTESSVVQELKSGLGYEENLEIGDVGNEENGILVETGLSKDGEFGGEEEETAASATHMVAAEILGHSDGDKVAEDPKVNDGVVSEVEGDPVLEKQEVEGIELKDKVELDKQNDQHSDGQKPTDFAAAGDAAVDTVGVHRFNSHESGHEDVEETKDSAEGKEVPIVESVLLDEGHGWIRPDSESVGLNIYSKPAAGFQVETETRSLPQENNDVTTVGGGETIAPEAVVVTAEAVDNQGNAAMVASSDIDDHSFVSTLGNGPEAENKGNQPADDKERSSMDEEETEIFGSSETSKQFLEELERGSGNGSCLGGESYLDHLERVDGQIVTDSDEEVDTDEEGDGKELFDSDTLAALLKAATNAGADGGNVTITSEDGSRLFSLERPAGLGSSIRSLRPAPQTIRPNLFTPSNLAAREGSDDNLTDEEKKKLEKLQQIRVKFFRLVHRLGYSSEDPMAQQVLYRLALAAGRQSSLFSVDAAKRTAVQLEAEGKDDLNFSLNILALGKTGVGKSATINSIFGEERALIDAFEPATTAVKEVVGTVDGVKIRFFDTPGLKSSAMEQGLNRKALSSIKKHTKSYPPDIVLYVDRLDSQTRDLNDLPLLKTITSSLGSLVWRSAIVTLTHAASAPPDGPSGAPMNYEAFVAQRSHVVQQSIGQAVGDMRVMNPNLMNPVTLVENHPSCRKNREGQKVLPNGSNWRPQLLLLCYSMKILSEVSSLNKSQDMFDHRKLFGFRVRPPHLPYLLSWLLQSRAHPKRSTDQGGENGDSDVDLDDLSDSDQEDGEDEYDQLPPFKPLRKSQIAKLSREQRKAYLEEYDYRVKLLQKKQWRSELKRMREMKKGKVALDDYGYVGEDFDQENGSPAAVPVPLPDMVLPPSFDSDNPAYRYRFLEPTSQFLARPVLDTHGWDHDCGYDGVNLEQSLAIVGRFPATVAAQIAKDKNEFTLHLDSAVSAKHGENGSTMVGFDIQNIGKQFAYILKGETKFKNWKKNKTTAGMTVTFLGENVAPGVKIEDQIVLGKRLVLVGMTGAVRCQGDAVYGANLEVRLREADYPIGQDQSTLALSLVKWRGDLALGANLLSQFSVGRSSKMAVRVALNNKLSGQITVRTSSSEQLQIGLMGILPIAMAIYKHIWPDVADNYSIY